MVKYWKLLWRLGIINWNNEVAAGETGLKQLVGESNCIWSLFEVLVKYSNRDVSGVLKELKESGV